MSKEEVIDVDVSTFPRLPALMARAKGPYGIRVVESGARIFWKVEDGVKWFLRNIDYRPMTFEVISLRAFEDRKEVTA